METFRWSSPLEIFVEKWARWFRSSVLTLCTNPFLFSVMGALSSVLRCCLCLSCSGIFVSWPHHYTAYFLSLIPLFSHSAFLKSSTLLCFPFVFFLYMLISVSSGSLKFGGSVIPCPEVTAAFWCKQFHYYVDTVSLWYFHFCVSWHFPVICLPSYYMSSIRFHPSYGQFRIHQFPSMWIL